MTLSFLSLVVAPLNAGAAQAVEQYEATDREESTIECMDSIQALGGSEYSSTYFRFINAPSKDQTEYYFEVDACAPSSGQTVCTHELTSPAFTRDDLKRSITDIKTWKLACSTGKQSPPSGHMAFRLYSKGPSDQTATYVGGTTVKITELIKERFITLFFGHYKNPFGITIETK